MLKNEIESYNEKIQKAQKNLNLNNIDLKELEQNFKSFKNDFNNTKSQIFSDLNILSNSNYTKEKKYK